jgi:hypothetical protein
MRGGGFEAPPFRARSSHLMSPPPTPPCLLARSAQFFALGPARSSPCRKHPHPSQLPSGHRSAAPCGSIRPCYLARAFLGFARGVFAEASIRKSSIFVPDLSAA